MNLTIKKAVKSMGRLRLALAGPAGSGKTYTALTVACNIAAKMGKKVLVVDTERGSAAKYADLFDFDVIELAETHHPGAYVEAIRMGAEAGEYGVVVLDSLSHAWVGKDGALALVDQSVKRSQAGNSYTAWRDVTPLHNALVDAIIGAPVHIIATLRSKTEYVVEVNERGKSVPRKIGLAPIQRDGMEYEFDVFGELNHSNSLVISKSRCSALNAAIIDKPGDAFSNLLYEWITTGVPIPEVKPAASMPILAVATAPVSAGDVVELDVAKGTVEPATVPAPKAPPSFEDVMNAERERIGAEVFDTILKIHGHTTIAEITDRDERIGIYNVVKTAVTAEPKPEPASKKNTKANRLASSI